MRMAAGMQDTNIHANPAGQNDSRHKTMMIGRSLRPNSSSRLPPEENGLRGQTEVEHPT
jgi:hypothetical protein